MPTIEFNRYYRHEGLSALLHQFAQEYEHLIELTSIGKSHEGRDIWLLAVTDRTSGPHHEKPAFWCDGNIHASEVSASTAVLHLLNRLCTQFGDDENVTRALRTRTFYLVPRLNPDGAEWALADKPRIIRSSTRPYPYDEDEMDGLERQDITGDGRVLNIRLVDPNGPWVVSEEEPRLLRRRHPGEEPETAYRLIPEGLFHNFDPMTLRGRSPKQRLDFNRNFPSAWRQENEQYGAGPFPTSEPEIRACVHAIVERPNICGAITFHTFSGVHLRPPSRMPDDDIPAEDLWIYQEFGVQGEKMTGYPAISNYHEFRYHPKEVITGVFDDWMYEHQGVFAWTTELWSPQRQAGITDYKYIEWFRTHPFEHDVQMLKWSDEKLGGKGYIDWQPFEHPQLGPVEIGGWDGMYAFRNPPPDYLEAEVAPHGKWAIWQALASPKLELRALMMQPLEDGLARIRFAVQNTGFLPTQVSEMALKKKLVRGVIAEIRREGDREESLGEQAPEWLISGKLREIGPQLRGWSGVSLGGFGWTFDETDDVAVFEWVVRSGRYHLVAKHDRAGVVRDSIEVP